MARALNYCARHKQSEHGVQNVSQSFTKFLKFRSFINPRNISCGPPSRLWNREVLGRPAFEYDNRSRTSGTSCFIVEDELPEDKPAPPAFVLGPVFLLLGLATSTAICTGVEENTDNSELLPASGNFTRDRTGRFCCKNKKTTP